MDSYGRTRVSLSLAIVVLHYRSVGDTIECLDSIARQAGPPFQTILVENGAVEPLGDDFEARYPWLQRVTLAENCGWSGGNNMGIRLALACGADVICLLNNDTVLPDGALARLMATQAALGPSLLHPVIDSYGDDALVQLDPSIPIPDYLKVTERAECPGVYQISAVNGACLLVHRDVFEAVGFIDERFFLLCEDADFARRAVNAGYPMFCDTAVRIQHKESRAFGGRRLPIKTYYGFRNTLLFYAKHENYMRNARKLLRDLAWMAWGTARAAGVAPGGWWHLLRWALSADPFARAARMGVRDYALRRFGKLRASDEDALQPLPFYGPNGNSFGASPKPAERLEFGGTACQTSGRSSIGSETTTSPSVS
jgi:GT2 family glycosyltransferase